MNYPCNFSPLKTRNIDKNNYNFENNYDLTPEEHRIRSTVNPSNQFRKNKK